MIHLRGEKVIVVEGKGEGKGDEAGEERQGTG
jgi:hypothetical protein